MQYLEKFTISGNNESFIYNLVTSYYIQGVSDTWRSQKIILLTLFRIHLTYHETKQLN